MATILIIDDRSINREVLSLLLDEHHYKVLEAEDGLQALELLHHNMPELIITDIAMPKMDGVTFVKELQANPKFASIPVIFYSATYRSVEAERLATISNVKYVLTKPCRPEIILETVEKVLRSTLVPVFENEDVLDEDGLRSFSNNTHLYKRNDRSEHINLRLTNLIEIGLDMSQEYDLDKLNYIMCKGGRQFLNACYSGIVMPSANKNNYYRNFYIGQHNVINYYLFNKNSISNTVQNIFLSERPHCIYFPIIDLKEIGLFDIPLPFTNLLCIPIKTPRGFYGTVYFINKHNQQLFTLSDQRFMMTLADKFAINYENLLLYKKIEKHSKELENEIAQRKQTEYFLNEISERLQLTLEASHVGTWSWFIQKNQILWDKYSCLLFGIEPEDFVGTLDIFLEKIFLEDRKRVHKELLAISQGENNQPIEFRVIWPDKSTHYLLLRGKVDYSEDGQPERVLGVYLDITEHVQSEEKLRQYRKKMAEVLRSSSVGEMASSLAHEINQPLAAITAFIRGCIKRIEKENNITPEIIEILHETALQAERAGEVVHRIKSFVRKGELFYEPININLLLDEVINMIQQEVQQYPLQLIFIKNEFLPLIDIDKIQIQQVILNLLRNAIEAMQASNIKHPKVDIDIKQNTENRILLKISDNGPGFNEEVANYLFEPYFSTKAEGMGLGLAICRSIIEAHSGQLLGESLHGGGSCFQFDLPIKKAS